MIPKEAIEKAIEGGWQYRDNTFIRNPIKTLIERDRIYVQGAPKGDGWHGGEAMEKLADLNYYKIALDPTFWQSLGKVLEWAKVGDNPNARTTYFGNYTWLGHAHCFYDVILSEGSTTEFWNYLLKEKPLPK